MWRGTGAGVGMPSNRRRNSKKKCGEAQERVWGCRQLDGVIRRRAQKRRADKCRQLADIIRRREFRREIRRREFRREIRRREEKISERRFPLPFD